MKRIVTGILIVMTNLASAQTEVKLRDVTFSVPAELYYFTEQDRKIDYEPFYEVGKIATDSVDVEKFPKIAYQYFEVPDFGVQTSKKVLTRLNEIMTKDIHPDTLIIKETENYSIAKYTIMGKSLFEVKSLGNIGWINIQFFDTPEHDQRSFVTIGNIINSIEHEHAYESDYEYHMKASGSYSKRALVFLSISLALFFGLKLLKKKKTSSEKQV
ncbi:hypothetical protein [uncultured Dokdonia sp.]|uniref:hypothetical protein n=1 Tax=uncultured Dokdonia sp. TaxID=575653 RepID=UPI0026176E6C|nr:hypothetical protein [uncultured Dokdonia sp.]